MPLTIQNSTLTLSSLSKEYIRVRVSGRKNGAEVDPTGFTLEFAFTEAANPPTEPEAADWQNGTWETDNDVYYARALVGPTTSFPLTDGTYDIWLRFDDGTEQPVRNVGRIIIT